MMPAPDRVPVLLAAGGAAWEASAVRMLADGSSGAVLLKRCVDLQDLLATASTGQASVAVMDEALAGLDADSVELLRRAQVGVVLLQRESGNGHAERAGRLGVEHLLPAAELVRLPAVVRAAGVPPDRRAGEHGEPVLAPPQPVGGGDREAGEVVAVWGPAGAPGRTTVAVGLAAELAGRGARSLLLDVDGYGGTVAQHLGILDEMSGLLAAARLANAGQLDEQRLVTLLRAVGPALLVLTGLPRADRWREVRGGAFDRLLELARVLGNYVVADTGFCLEQEPDVGFGGGGAQRNGMTVASLEEADQVVVVGTADPVGLARLARGLVELHDLVPAATVRVVVNRCRPSLGWGEQEIRAMVEGFASPASLHLAPEDRSAVDRALLHGRSPVELGDSALRRAVAELADAVTGTSVRRRRRLLRR